MDGGRSALRTGLEAVALAAEAATKIKAWCNRVRITKPSRAEGLVRCQRESRWTKRSRPQGSALPLPRINDEPGRNFAGYLKAIRRHGRRRGAEDSAHDLSVLPNSVAAPGRVQPYSPNDLNRSEWHDLCRVRCITPLGFRLSKRQVRERLSRLAISEAEPRRDKSPGDLHREMLRHSNGQASASRSFEVFRSSIEAPARPQMWSTQGTGGADAPFLQTNSPRSDRRPPPSRLSPSRHRRPRKRKTSKSPGRSMSAGCRGAMPPIPAS